MTDTLEMFLVIGFTVTVLPIRSYSLRMAREVDFGLKCEMVCAVLIIVYDIIYVNHLPSHVLDIMLSHITNYVCIYGIVTGSDGHYLLCKNIMI